MRHSVAIMTCIQKATKYGPSSMDTLKTLGKARIAAPTVPKKATPAAKCIACLLKWLLRTAIIPEHKMSAPQKLGTKAVGALQPVTTNPTIPITTNIPPMQTDKNGIR